MSIDLAQNRVFAFEVGKRKYTMTLKPITKKMWLKYFAGIVSTQELTDEGVASSFDASGARLELLESALIGATGYTREGEQLPDGWQAKLPMGHRRAASDFLMSVEVVPATIEDEDAFPALGFETVTLKAVWTANDEGKMQQVTGLRHMFGSPTADHQVRYSRAMSRSVVMGGRNGQTRWIGAQDVLIEIYDELIQYVAGYSSGDRELTNLVEVRDLMDCYHKVAAATALFTPVEVDAQ